MSGQVKKLAGALLQSIAISFVVFLVLLSLARWLIG